MIKAIIFDVGSVLVYEHDRTPREQAAQKLGLSYDALVDAVFGHPLDTPAALGHVTTAQFWDAVGVSLNLTEPQTSALHQEFFAGNRVDMDLVAFARVLQQTYQTAILSNALDDLRHMLDHVWNISDAFDKIVISAETGCKKPSPEIYQIALSQLGVAPEEALFIDDLPENIAAANQLGIAGVEFKNTGQDLALLKNQILTHLTPRT